MLHEECKGAWRRASSAAIKAASERRPPEIVMRSIASGRTAGTARFAVVVFACVALGACSAQRPIGGDVTGSIPQGASASRARLADLQKRYEQNPGDAQSAIAYGAALRASGQRAQSVAVLQQAAIRNPKDTTVLGAYGRALADTGQLQQALDVLSRAHTPDRPDWRILNVQGAVLDQMGRNAEAQGYYQTALRIAPGEPSALSNLGLSYALAKDLPRAEATLRQAAASPKADARVRQNLALVLSLQGRIGEAETLARADLPPGEAQASIEDLRRLASSAKTAPPSAAALAPAPGAKVAALPAE
jgi:Flp pilus assembly protein TadD